MPRIGGAFWTREVTPTSEVPDQDTRGNGRSVLPRTRRTGALTPIDSGPGKKHAGHARLAECLGALSSRSWGSW